MIFCLGSPYPIFAPCIIMPRIVSRQILSELFSNQVSHFFINSGLCLHNNGSVRLVTSYRNNSEKEFIGVLDLLLSSTEIDAVCIIESRYDRSESTMTLFVTPLIVDTLVKKFTIGRAIFLRVPLQAYFCGEGRQITSCMIISVMIGVYI